jgi:hypothetical protein
MRVKAAGIDLLSETLKGIESAAASVCVTRQEINVLCLPGGRIDPPALGLLMFSFLERKVLPKSKSISNEFDLFLPENSNLCRRQITGDRSAQIDIKVSALPDSSLAEMSRRFKFLLLGCQMQLRSLFGVKLTFFALPCDAEGERMNGTRRLRLEWSRRKQRHKTLAKWKSGKFHHRRMSEVILATAKKLFLGPTRPPLTGRSRRSPAKI